VDTISEAYEKERLLIASVLRGDHNAFAEIIRRSESMVTSILCNMIRIEEDRKDIAQEVYLKAYKNLAGFKHQCKISTWICQITYNTCLNHLVKRRITSGVDLNLQRDINKPELHENGFLVPESQFIETEIFNKDLSLILQREISKLMPIYQTLIGLFHQEEMSYQEIGQITQLPEGTVKSYLYRARKALKENILLNYKPEDL
jgi:RNA polymerase sigma-70 factor (ECF subfamily)